jgi:hypothetical protein
MAPGPIQSKAVSALKGGIEHRELAQQIKNDSDIAKTDPSVRQDFFQIFEQYFYSV